MTIIFDDLLVIIQFAILKISEFRTFFITNFLILVERFQFIAFGALSALLLQSTQSVISMRIIFNHHRSVAPPCAIRSLRNCSVKGVGGRMAAAGFPFDSHSAR